MGVFYWKGIVNCGTFERIIYKLFIAFFKSDVFEEVCRKNIRRSRRQLSEINHIFLGQVTLDRLPGIIS